MIAKFKILIGIAFSPNLKANIFEAARLANYFNAQLIGVHVGESSSAKQTQLKALLQIAPKLPFPIRTIWKEGNPVKIVLQICNQENIDLLILGALQRENLYKYYVGSIARKLTLKAPCSVLLFIKPSIESSPCKHIVVNGLKDEKTEQTIIYTLGLAKKLNCKRLTIVEEIGQDELSVKVSDDKTLQEVTLIKEQIKKQEDLRINRILNQIDNKDITVNTQSIFGRQGYSIGHYAKVKRADLLVMNAPSKLKFWDKIFPHDIAYILYELPTDVLIVRQDA